MGRLRPRRRLRSNLRPRLGLLRVERTDPNAEPQFAPRAKRAPNPQPNRQRSRHGFRNRGKSPCRAKCRPYGPVISPAQGKRFFAIMKSAGLSDEDCKKRLASIGYHGHRDGIPKSMYEKAIDAIDPDFRFHTNTPRD